MKQSWISILLVAGLLGLLVLLATMQYQWLGQISSGERERLQKRLEIDTQRFTEDFNREIQTAYYPFQFEADVWRDDSFTAFSKRYMAWREQAKFPGLIKDIYLIRGDELLRYDTNTKNFNRTTWTSELEETQRKYMTGEDAGLIDEKNLTLIMPVYENPVKVFIPENSISISGLPSPLSLGFLAIKLDENVIKSELLPSLFQEYFSNNDGSGYKLSIVSQNDENKLIFNSQNSDEIVSKTADASVPVFNLSPDNFTFIVNPQLLSKVRMKSPDRSIVINQKIETHRLTTNSNGSNRTGMLRVETLEGQPRKIFRRIGSDPLAKSGQWLLNVQHLDGSLERFVANARYKNLAVSFGILLLLAASMVLIFLSTRRVRILAQRQMDFVSAVSHEFRTPLAVIYSAGENLTDGVVSTATQVSQYGNLIKREGKKLSAMVEQILEFAGARSGHKRYDLRETDVRNVVENALEECQNLLIDKDFMVETELAEKLPKISADANALSHAVQNLIINAVKYSNDNKLLKVSATNGGGVIKIIVEDHGIGISSKDLPHIFTPFYRAKSVVDAQIHGNGLGLSLVKQTVKAHDGKVFVESEAGKGSKFTIQLPVIN